MALLCCYLPAAWLFRGRVSTLVCLVPYLCGRSTQLLDPAPGATQSQTLNERVWTEIMKTWACSAVFLTKALKEGDHAVSKSVIGLVGHERL